MNIRHAQPEDVAGIRRVAERTWEADYPDILNRENVGEVADEWYADDRMKEELKNEDAIVILTEEDGEIVGFAYGIWARRTGHILRVYVDPDHRRSGIGRELLAAVRDSLLRRGADRIQAMVLAENDLGNQFYQDAGFEKIDEGETTIGEETYTENVYRRRG